MMSQNEASARKVLKGSAFEPGRKYYIAFYPSFGVRDGDAHWGWAPGTPGPGGIADLTRGWLEIHAEDHAMTTRWHPGNEESARKRRRELTPMLTSGRPYYIAFFPPSKYLRADKPHWGWNPGVRPPADTQADLTQGWLEVRLSDGNDIWHPGTEAPQEYVWPPSPEAAPSERRGRMGKFVSFPEQPEEPEEHERDLQREYQRREILRFARHLFGDEAGNPGLEETLFPLLYAVFETYIGSHDTPYSTEDTSPEEAARAITGALREGNSDARDRDIANAFQALQELLEGATVLR